MKQRPILFNGAMVRAILSGQKTQTRRIAKHKGDLPPEWATFAQEISSIAVDGSCKPSDLFRWSEEQTEGQAFKSLRRWPGNGADLVHDWYAIPCPYGKQGDQFWVREAFSAMGDADMHAARIFYRADGEDGERWTPSIHMPRWASRITLEITGVRVERLNDISKKDAAAEGFTKISKDDGKTWKYGIPDRDGLPGTDDSGWP